MPHEVPQVAQIYAAFSSRLDIFIL